MELLVVVELEERKEGRKDKLEEEILYLVEMEESS